MPRDPQMQIVRQQVNAIIDRCAVAAEAGGPAAVLALKLVETDELPPKPPLRISDEYAARLAQQAAARQCDCGVTP